jgi:hypothetical protein
MSVDPHAIGSVVNRDPDGQLIELLETKGAGRA